MYTQTSSRKTAQWLLNSLTAHSSVPMGVLQRCCLVTREMFPNYCKHACLSASSINLIAMRLASSCFNLQKKVARCWFDLDWYYLAMASHEAIRKRSQCRSFRCFPRGGDIWHIGDFPELFSSSTLQ